MTTKESAHPTAATVEQAGMEMATYGKAAISCNHFITGDVPRQLRATEARHDD